MADQDKEQEYREEDLMAGGPVSRGASNKSAPMYSDKQPAGKKDDERPAEQQQPDYNKMLHTQNSGTETGSGMATQRRVETPGGGTVPTESETGASRGGRLTTNSTVSAGGSSGGAVAGANQPRDRGTNSDADLEQSTNMEGQINRNG
jgi:hypothetical protein